jgi:hypothetical protein
MTSCTRIICSDPSLMPRHLQLLLVVRDANVDFVGVQNWHFFLAFMTIELLLYQSNHVLLNSLRARTGPQYTLGYLGACIKQIF